jgi:hypothetical protein
LNCSDNPLATVCRLYLCRPTRNRRRLSGAQPLARRFLPKCCEELGQRSPQCRGELAQSYDPNIAFAAFDATNIVPMERRTRSEFFLGYPDFLPQRTNPFTDGPRQLISHSAMLAGCTR